MLYVLSLAGATVVNAFGRRFAGGLLSQWVGNIGGTMVARGVQAALMALTVFAVSLLTNSSEPFWLAPAAFLATFLGATMGFPTGMVPTGVKDLLGLAAHGIGAVAALAAGAFFLGYSLWWLILGAGVFRAFAYWVATKWCPRLPLFGLFGMRDNGLVVDPPPLAEFYSGGAMGLAVATTLLF